MNDLKRYQVQLDQVQPWEGEVPKGYLVDFVGALTDARFRVDSGIDPAAVGGKYVQTNLPTIGDGNNGEGWFEAVNWMIAARAARDRYVMITLGACYGSQAVGAYRMMQMLNPLPCKLVAVEPEPENFNWVARHFRDNGLDPADHWLVPMAISNANDPVFFPVGSPGTGAQNCLSTNDGGAREEYAKYYIREGRAVEALWNLLRNNTTGLTKDLVPGRGYKAEIKYMSAITLRDLLSPLDIVDYLESDVQQSEIIVFPPFMELLRKKVKLVHIGTHGKETHETLRSLFAADGWEILFCFEPNERHISEFGSFLTNDGVLTARNPSL